MIELRKRIPLWVYDHLPLFLLPLLSVLLYLPSLHNGFIIDDIWLVTENPYIKSWKYLLEMLSKDAWNVWDRHNYWRPVFSISLALDYSLWGLNPFGFHLTNILLHAANVVLVYLLGKKLQNTTCAVFASLLFALHPIQAHAVNVISIRGDLLAAFFTLLSLHGFFLRKKILFALALVFALLSKETSMVLPLALLAAWVITEGDNKQDLRLTLAFITLGLYLVVRLSLGFSFSLPPSSFSYHASLVARLLLVCKVLALYFLALVNLFGTPHPFWTVEIPATLNDLQVIGGGFIFLLLLGAILWSWKRKPVVAFGLTWFVIYFLPISNLKQLNQPMAEHWLYLPMIGISLALGTALGSFLLQLPKAHLIRPATTAALAAFLFFGSLVVREKTKIYHDEESFLLAAIRANPRVVELYSNLAAIYLAKKDSSRARDMLAKALELNPDDFLANYFLGSHLYEGGQYGRARIHLEKVVRYYPVRLYELFFVGDAWEMLGDKQKALFYYHKALDMSPESAQIKQKVLALEEAATLPLR